MSDLSQRPAAPSFSVGFLSGLGGQLAYLLLALPASVLLARLLGPEGKGAADLALLLPTLVTLFANFGFGYAGSYLVGSRRFPPGEIIATMVSLWLLMAALLTPAYACLAAFGLLAPLAPHVGRSLLLLGALGIPLGLGRQILGSLLLGLQRFIAYNSVQVLFGGASLVGVVGFVWLASLGPGGGVAASVTAQLVCVLYVLFMLRGAWPGYPRLNGGILREAVWYGARGQVGDILQFFNYRLDVILLGHFRSLAEVGLYTLAVSLAELLWYIPHASALVVLPRTAASQAEARHLTPLVFRMTWALTFLGALVVAGLARPLIRMVYGEAFLGSLGPFLILLPGVVCLGGAKVLSADLGGRGAPGYNSIGALVSLVVTVILDLALIPGRGASGAALASSLAYATTLVYTYAIYAKLTRMPTWGLLRFGRSDLHALRDTFARLRGARTP